MKLLIYYLLENCGARRAFLSPYFLRSLTLGSLVTKPAFLSTLRYESSLVWSALASNSINALVIA